MARRQPRLAPGWARPGAQVDETLDPGPWSPMCWQIQLCGNWWQLEDDACWALSWARSSLEETCPFQWNGRFFTADLWRFVASSHERCEVRPGLPLRAGFPFLALGEQPNGWPGYWVIDAPAEGRPRPVTRWDSAELDLAWRQGLSEISFWSETFCQAVRFDPQTRPLLLLGQAAVPVVPAVQGQLYRHLIPNINLQPRPAVLLP